MAYKLKKKIANRANYGGKRSISKIEWIVLHYTGNDGDTDENNGNYFANNIIKASAHAFVDDDSVTISVPDDYVAYAVAGSKYSNCSETGGGKCFGKVTNTNSYSIEICDDVKNGVVYPSKKTIENALAYAEAKAKEFGIPKSRIIRHFDVNGKPCPKYWCGTAEKDKLWKTEFWNKLDLSEGSKATSEVKKTADDDKLTLDGKWGTDTTYMSQKVFGTYKDGIVSNQPKANKDNLPNCTTASWKFEATLKEYKDGSALIKAIQKYLNKLEYYKGEIDGWCGKKTVIAIQKFLKAKGFYTGIIDGIAGKKTVIGWQKYINSRL